MLAAGHSVGQPLGAAGEYQGGGRAAGHDMESKDTARNYWDNTAPIFKQLCAEITLRLIVLATAVSNRMGYVAPTNMKMNEEP